MSEGNEFNTTLRRGDCWNLVVTWDTTEDLTGYTAEFAISWPRQVTSGGVIAAGEVEAEPVVGATAKTFTVDLTASETLTVLARSIATYQLRAVAPDGCKATIAVGNLTILGDYIG